MGRVLGFKDLGRETPPHQPVETRVRHWREFYEAWPGEKAQAQAGRCMDCAVPFCHMGCPLGNLIPDWNDLVYRGRWKRALEVLHSTNNFPEFTGRVCPALCEAACVLGINRGPATIEAIERAIADRGFQEGWVRPEPPAVRTGKKVAIVGSGPAGLAAAQQLNCAGHTVTVFERDTCIGGLLTLGIPEFKLEKQVVQRRVSQLASEGIIFKPGVNVGVDLTADELRGRFNAVLLAGGATQARDLPIPGRELKGIHLAMEYLRQQNQVLAGETVAQEGPITAQGKRVVILGGGDTGADCLGTAIRQGAKAVYQFELLPEPPMVRQSDNPWPQWPLTLRLSPAHAEGGLRDYSILTKAFSGRNGHVERLHAVRVEWGSRDHDARPTMKEIPGSGFETEADLVLLALGFLGPEQYLLRGLGVELDARGNVKTGPNHVTSVPGVFAAGDMRRGQSLVVWAIAEGRDAAYHMDKHLMGSTKLPRSLLGAPAR